MIIIKFHRFTIKQALNLISINLLTGFIMIFIKDFDYPIKIFVLNLFIFYIIWNKYLI